MVELKRIKSLRGGCGVANVQKFGKRLQALQDKGLEIEVIGRKDRFLDLRRKFALGRFLKSLVLTHKGLPLMISPIEAPEPKGDHVEGPPSPGIPRKARR
jgi:hypothetical protein